MNTPQHFPAIPSIDPLHLFMDDLDGHAAEPKARIRAALAGGRFLAALLVQQGVDTDMGGDAMLTACPEWTYGIGAALAAVLHSIESAGDELRRAQQLAERLSQGGGMA